MKNIKAKILQRKQPILTLLLVFMLIGLCSVTLAQTTEYGLLHIGSGPDSLLHIGSSTGGMLHLGYYAGSIPSPSPGLNMTLIIASLLGTILLVIGIRVILKEEFNASIIVAIIVILMVVTVIFSLVDAMR